MPTTPTPNLLQDPGYLHWAPLLTAEPANTVSGSKFTDAWPVAWINLGATDAGSTFRAATTIEAVTVAELLNPVKYATTGKTSGLAFALASYTLNNLKRVLNGGAITTVSGLDAATRLSKYEEPDAGAEVRCMLGWESQDATVRIIARQAFNAATIESAFQRAPARALLAADFSFEQPVAGKPFTIYAAGDARVGT